MSTKLEEDRTGGERSHLLAGIDLVIGVTSLQFSSKNIRNIPTLLVSQGTKLLGAVSFMIQLFV